MESLAESTATRIEEVYEHLPHPARPAGRGRGEVSSESLNSGVGVAVIDNTTGKAVYDSSAVTIADGTGRVPKRIGRGHVAELGQRAHPGAADQRQPAVRQRAHRVRSATAVGSVRIWVYGSETLLTQADDAVLQQLLSGHGVRNGAGHRAGVVHRLPRSRARWRAPSTPWRSTARADSSEGDLSARTGIRGEDEIARLGDDLRRDGRPPSSATASSNAASPPTSRTSCARRSWPSRQRSRPWSTACSMPTRSALRR